MIEIYLLRRKQTLSFEALGTLNSVELFCTDAVFSKISREIVDRVNTIELEMSAFLPNSDIGRINFLAGKKTTVVSHDTMTVLAAARKIGLESGGAFDITVNPLMKLWRRSQNGCIPDREKIAEAMVLTGLSKLVLDVDKKSAGLYIKGGALDLGAIAKGFAADEAEKTIKSVGITSAIVNFGGNIFTVGSNKRKPWRVGVQNPTAARGESIGTLSVTDKSVVTSAVNERFFIKDGQLYHHIIDPRTGYPSKSGLLSVTVVATSSMVADALSTAAFVLGKDKALPLLAKYNAEAVFTCESGEIFCTAGLKDSFEATDKITVYR